jgi:tetratricopeptide (TPR) repeat protein
MSDPSKSICRKLDALYAAGKLDRVEEYLLTELIKNQPRNGEFSASFITVLFELGVYFRNIKKYSRSRDWFLLLGRVVSCHLGETSVAYAAVLENVASTYELAGNFDPALHLFMQALQIYKGAKGPRPIRYARLKRHICALFGAQGDFHAALIFYPLLPGMAAEEGHVSGTGACREAGRPKISKVLLFRCKE